MKNLYKIIIPQWHLANGKTLTDVVLSYQFFGPVLGTAPVVLVNHSITSNSNISGPDGWWKYVIGEDRVIDTNYFFTALAFNIPGNEFDNDESIIYNYKDFTAADVAQIFWQGLEELEIYHLHSIIGVDLGGGIAWEMAALRPNSVSNLIPVAADWKPLSYLKNGVRDLDSGFVLPSFRLFNQLLATVDITKHQSFEAVAKNITAAIHLIAIDTDLLFTAYETRNTFEFLRQNGNEVYYSEIRSTHGHDAYLKEWEQLSEILAPVFQDGYHTMLRFLQKAG
ncbi:alpha/beta fold hydrolase [Flavobacterium sp. Sd200]|uniref:alpha/beta fold hydrolase n=1 Tax=Flavobacterium sp. Sd200 TaxID=2692211 RepID=UPI001369CF33|nr:alpha/beta fold hydrolase [Flavobacterium sp. Sd200]MXN91771.1 alpha/beta fold hydrolase [Flavobacterium sp. Sd200]